MAKARPTAPSKSKAKAAATAKKAGKVAKKAAKQAALGGVKDPRALPPQSEPDMTVPPDNPASANAAPHWAQEGDVLTTTHGTRLSSTNDSLRAGSRGPTLLEDFHLREKIMHFDHERIPERVVHARGAAAHGHFQLYESQAAITQAQFLNDTGTATPVFVRFSTVVGSRGSADTARDVRGFATKFYTEEGNFDLVGNNIPIFFIQDGIKFPDLIHAVKPEPHREIPQAQSAHDTFWDFVSLQPESTAMLMWVMSDRGIPRSYRTMEGFGVHTFRLVNATGDTTLVKFHWKPAAGIHSLVWEESQKLGGIDPDFHRRDLWDAIEAGAFPEYELGLQTFPDTEDQFFEGIDLLDSTKIVPEELAPVRIVGKLTLDANPANFFAQTEQVAFHTGHLVPGIDITDDPLLHARMFSYLDTQLTRLGGPNFNQIPINRPLAPVNTDQRDGLQQHAVHEGRAAYFPNSVGGGCPFVVGADQGGYVHVPRSVAGDKVRERAASFADHFSQATLFWNSMSPPEKEHIVGAFSFELSKVEDPVIRERVLSEQLVKVAGELAERVAANLGMEVPPGRAAGENDPSLVSAALSMAPATPGPIDARAVAMVAADGVDGAGLAAVEKAISGANARIDVVAPHSGEIQQQGKRAMVKVAKTTYGCQSVEFDAVVLAPGAGLADLAADTALAVFFQEAYRHHKTVGAWGDAVAVLSDWGIDTSAPGVVTATGADKGFGKDLVTAIGWHRHWSRPRP